MVGPYRPDAAHGGRKFRPFAFVGPETFPDQHVEDPLALESGDASLVSGGPGQDDGVPRQPHRAVDDRVARLHAADGDQRILFSFQQPKQAQIRHAGMEKHGLAAKGHQLHVFFGHDQNPVIPLPPHQLRQRAVAPPDEPGAEFARQPFRPLQRGGGWRNGGGGQHHITRLNIFSSSYFVNRTMIGRPWGQVNGFRQAARRSIRACISRTVSGSFALREWRQAQRMAGFSRKPAMSTASFSSRSHAAISSMIWRSSPFGNQWGQERTMKAEPPNGSIRTPACARTESRRSMIFASAGVNSSVSGTRSSWLASSGLPNSSRYRS